MAKAKSKAISESMRDDLKRPGFSVEEMAEVLMTIPDISEAFTKADLELALDDRGWLTTSSHLIRELDPQTRKILLTKSRLYWHRDPLAHQAVRLWTDYALATGIEVNTEDAAQQAAIVKFMRDKRNREVLSSEGQRKSSKKLLVDGEVFFAIFGAAGEDKVIRRVDPMQITDIITDPDDEERILAYRRQLADGKTHLYYADWTADEEARALAEQQEGPNHETISLESGVVMYLLPFDAFGKRGNGLLFPVVDWTREHRRFMEARVAITQALSKYANKLTVKGGQALLDNIKSRMESTYAQGGTTQIERHPSPAPGSTWLQNAGAELTPMPRVTGGSEARDDSDSLKLMVCAGTGIMLHYFGDPSTGNLATATAMELPMLKMFAAYQNLWLEAYRDILSIVLDEDPEAEPAVIDIDLPPILQDDVQNLATALTAFVGVFPEIAVDDVLRMVLVQLNVNNVDDVMKSIEKKRQEQATQDAANKARMDKLIGAQGPPGGPVKKNPAANTATPDEQIGNGAMLSNEAAHELAGALAKVAEAINL